MFCSECITLIGSAIPNNPVNRKDSLMEKFLVTLIVNVLSNASPVIKDALKGVARDLKEKAEKTPNPWDDILANLFGSIAGV